VQGAGLRGDGPGARYAIAHGFDGLPEGANFSVMDECFRYTLYPSCNYEELFDHRADRLESRNLAADPAFAADRERLRGALAEAQLRAVNPVAGRLASW
jgi:hypothetical protein